MRYVAVFDLQQAVLGRRAMKASDLQRPVLGRRHLQLPLKAAAENALAGKACAETDILYRHA